MDLSLTCDCGAVVPVTQSMCGSQIQCACGQSITVPRLSELRRNAGLSPIDVSAADKLLALSIQSELPLEKECCQCGQQTDMFLNCTVECERTYSTKISFLSYFLQSLILPWFIVTLIKRDYDNPEVHGREVALKTPLRFCWDCWSARKMDRQVCIAYLRKNPLYAGLLDDYPHAGIVWAQSLSKSP